MNATRSTVPFHLQVLIVFLEIDPVLDAPKVALVIVVQNGGDFRRPGIGVVEVPTPHSLHAAARTGIGVITYIVTDRI